MSTTDDVWGSKIMILMCVWSQVHMWDLCIKCYMFFDCPGSHVWVEAYDVERTYSGLFIMVFTENNKDFV